MLKSKIKGMLSGYFNRVVAENRKESETTRMLLARQISRSFDYKGAYTSINDFGFKVFSQWSDDGIIQFIINRLKDMIPETFVELGVENYQESNTRFLLQNDNWKGLIVDGLKENIEFVKKTDNYWRHSLTAKDVFITKANVNAIIKDVFTGDIGLLSIDIDGNDYWIWQEINVINPAIVIVEYNSIFGMNPWTIPYAEDFQRTKCHYSNLYYGMSLSAANVLSKKLRYKLIGCNSNGNNAYFVAEKYAHLFNDSKPEELFVMSRFRESRTEQGELSLLEGHHRLDLLKSLNIFDVDKNELVTIK